MTQKETTPGAGGNDSGEIGTNRTLNSLERDMQRALSVSEAAVVSRNSDHLIVTFQGDATFDSGSALVKPGLHAEIDRVARVLAQYPEMIIRVEGHTDSDPIQRAIFLDNLHLSMARAVNVTRKITDDLEPRISPDRVRAVACGEYYPISTNKAKNRRIEIVFTPLY